MKISRLMMIGLLATSLLASCKKEDNTGNTNPNLNLDGISFKASTEKGNPNARTYLAYDKIKWMSGDQILVQNSANQQAAFEVVEGIDSQDGVFYTGSTSFDRSPNYAAAYPYDKASISGTTATFTIPQQQSITTTGTFGNGTMPMVAYSSNNVLNFKNVFGGICFPLQGNMHVTKIVLTSKNTAEKLWGTFTVDCTSDDPTPAYVTGSGGSNSIELTCNATLTDEKQEFIIMVPPTTMQTGFTVKAFNGTTEVYSKTYDLDESVLGPGVIFIQRSHVSELQPITINNTSTLVPVSLSPTYIDVTSARSAVSSVSGGTPTEQGICWALASVTNLPTIDNDHHASGIGASYTMTGLTKDQVYYVRAYAKNENGVVTYGEAIPFATRKDYPNDYQGRIPYNFSVSGSKKVNFSMGNLYYMGADGGYWKFADYQFDYLTNDQANENANIDRDKFSFATSNQNHGAVFPQPWSCGYYNGVYYFNCFYAYHNSQSGDWNHNLREGSSHNADWGYNAIRNGGKTLDQWHTLNGPTGFGTSGGEWEYLLESRSGHRYATAQLQNVRDKGNVNGMLIFPDGFNWQNVTPYYPYSTLQQSGNYNVGVAYTTNTMNEAQWSILEKFGVAFLPAAGFRNNTGNFVWRFYRNSNGTPNHNYPVTNGSNTAGVPDLNQAYLYNGSLQMTSVGQGLYYWSGSVVNYGFGSTYNYSWGTFYANDYRFVHSWALAFEVGGPVVTSITLRNLGLAVRLVQ